MQLPIGVDRDADQTLYLQIFEQIRHLIVDGRCKPGLPLPASRVLASDLGVSRNTVALAYAELASEGYVETRQPTGTYVSPKVVFDGPSLPLAPATDEHHLLPIKRRERLVFRGESHAVVSPYAKPVAYDFAIGRPDARLFPAKIWQRLMNRALCRAGADLSPYDEPAGLWTLRQAVADHVAATRGVQAEPSQVLIVNGIQEGLSLVARLFLQAGATVVTENPCYLGATNLFASHGAVLKPVPVDEEGIDVAHLPREASIVYLTPSHQYPTGATLSLARRNRLIDWASRHHAYIVEDDSHSDFCHERAPLTALQGLDRHDQVIYLGTFSHSLAPATRLGYMILPPPLVAAATTAKALLNDCSARLPQEVLAQFLTSGGFMHHLRRIRTIYRARRDCLLAALEQHFGQVDVRGGGGMHLLWRLPPAFPVAAELARRCRAHGVGVYSTQTANVTITADAQTRFARSLLLGYAALDEAQIVEGVRRIAMALEPAGSKPCAAAATR